MRVLISTFGCDGGKSGVSQYLIHLMHTFPELASDIYFDVLTFEEESALYEAGSDRVKFIYAKDRVRSPAKNILWQQIALPRYCAQRSYDVLFIPAGNRRMPYWVPCPSVGTFHDLAIRHIPLKYDRLHALYNLKILPALVRRLSMVIVDSLSTKQDVLEYVGVPEERIRVIPLAVSDRYSPRDKAESQQYVSERYGIRAPYLLYLSRIEHPGKNHVRLIHAFTELKKKDKIPHQLVLVGSNWHGADKVEAAVARSEAADDILLTGFVEREDLPELYCGSDVFVFPSLFEGFGLPVLEAMASGVPVACSNTSSLPEITGDAAIQFDPESEEAIEQALRTIVTDSGVQQTCSRKGILRSKEFSWRETAEETLEVFRIAAALR